MKHNGGRVAALVGPMPDGLVELGPAAPRSGRQVGAGRADGDALAGMPAAVGVDAVERRPLFRSAEMEPLCLFVLRVFTRMLDWLVVELAVGVRLMMARLRLFLLCAFVTAEDFRLAEVMPICLKALEELRLEVWQSLMHVSTSPKPFMQPPNPELAARGLGEVGMYHISDELWDECVGAEVDVERLAADFAPDMQPTEGKKAVCGGERQIRWSRPCCEAWRGGGGSSSVRIQIRRC